MLSPRASVPAVLLVCLLATCATPESVRPLAERTLLWSDEFAGTSLDTTNWNYELGDGCPKLCGWGNQEQQWYTKDNHRVADGKLYLTARRDGDRYTSTRITTKDKHEFQYGRIEARLKLPVGKGLWPAFWTLGENIDRVGWPRCGEIDIMEYVGRKPGQIFTTLHRPAGHGDQGSSRITEFPGIEEDFHVYAIEWTAKQIDFFVDDRLVNSFAPAKRTPATWPFVQPNYLLLNLAVGGRFGGQDIDDSKLPQEFIVDYVRVYAPLSR